MLAGGPVAALSATFGVERSSCVLVGIDDYDGAAAETPLRVISQLVRQLSAPTRRTRLWPATPSSTRWCHASGTARASSWSNARSSWARSRTWSQGGDKQPVPHINASPPDPVMSRGAEGVLGAIERGGVPERARAVRAIRADPNGPVATELGEALDSADASGTVGLLRRELASAQDPDRCYVVRRLRRAWRASGMTHGELAYAAGTSTARMTACLCGGQAPTARVAARIEPVAANSAH